MTEAERALSRALLAELAPDHADHYTGRLAVELTTGRAPDEDGKAWLDISIDADPTWCDCGEYLAGVIVARPPGGRDNIYTDEETQALVSRLTGVRLW